MHCFDNESCILTPYKILKRLIFLGIVLVSPSICAQSITSGYLGINYWMPSWVSNGRIEQVWDQIDYLQPEIVRIGGNDCRGRYYGVERYDEMLDSIESIGAIPFVQLSGRWSKDKRIELLNHFKSSNRQNLYFAINNEEDDHQFEGWLDKAVLDHKQIAQEIRDVFPDAVIAGPAFKGFDPYEMPNHEYFLSQILNEKDANGEYILNIYDVHSYTTSFNTKGVPLYDIEAFKSRLKIVLDILDAANAVRSAQDKVSWTLSEFNVSYRNEGLVWVDGKQYPIPDSHRTYSFYAGQFWAQMFAYGIEKNAFAIIPWSVHESGGSRSNLDIGMFDNNEAPYVPRSNYRHMLMLTRNLKDNAATVKINVEDVESIALTDSTGTTVMIMNTGGNQYTMSLALKLNCGKTSPLLVEVDVNLNTIIDDVLPPASTKLLVFDAFGSLVHSELYAKED